MMQLFYLLTSPTGPTVCTIQSDIISLNTVSIR